jgi:hypothetical protein
MDRQYEHRGPLIASRAGTIPDSGQHYERLAEEVNVVRRVIWVAKRL